MADSNFWRDIAVKFRVLDPTGTLRADWHQSRTTSHIPPDVSERWRIVGPDPSVELEFEALARRAGIEISPEADSLAMWLDAVRINNATLEPPSYEEAPDGSIAVIHMSATIHQVAIASANYCKIMESKTIELERVAKFEEQQKSDPRNWSPLRRHLEATRKMKELSAGPHEQIPEEVVRRILAQQYGVTPEQITWKQIRLEVTGLFPHYPAITVIPTQPDPPPVSPRKVPPSETVGEQIKRLREECRWTIEQLAEFVDVHERTVSRHELGEVEPYARTLSIYERIFYKHLGRKVVISKMP